MSAGVNKLAKITLVLGMVAAAAYINRGLFVSLNNVCGISGISRVIVSQMPVNPQYQLSILFIGNSYTFCTDIPGKLVQIAETDPQNQTRFIVQSVTKPGGTLTDALEEGYAMQVINSRHWDYVVLQDHSSWALKSEFINDTSFAVKELDKEIKKANARTLIFIPWAAKAGSKWYEGATSYMRNPYYYQQQFNIESNELAKRIGAVAIPVGDFWAKVLQKDPEFPLFMMDERHPGSGGSYLSALVFYRYLAAHDVRQETYAPAEVTQAQANLLRDIVKW